MGQNLHGLNKLNKLIGKMQIKRKFHLSGFSFVKCESIAP